jgi:hypothetical protein
MPTAAATSPPPRAPADLYGTPAAPPEPPGAADPDPQWFEDPEAPEPPVFEAPDPPDFDEPEPPRFDEPEPTVSHEVITVEPAEVDIEAPQVDDEDVEVWEPRATADPPPDNGEQWRGIRPLGPVPRADDNDERSPHG